MIRSVALLYPIVLLMLIAEMAEAASFKLKGGPIIARLNVHQKNRGPSCDLFAVLFDRNGYMAADIQEGKRDAQSDKQELAISFGPSGLNDQVYSVILFAQCTKPFGGVQDLSITTFQCVKHAQILLRQVDMKKFAADNIVAIATIFRSDRDNSWWYDGIEEGCNTQNKAIAPSIFVEDQFFKRHWYPVLDQRALSDVTPITVLRDDRGFSLNQLRQFRFVLDFEAVRNGWEELFDLNVHLADLDGIKEHVDFHNKDFVVWNMDGTAEALAKHRGRRAPNIHGRSSVIVDVDLPGIERQVNDVKHIVFSATNRLGGGIFGMKGAIFRVESRKTHAVMAVYRLPYLKRADAFIIADFFRGKGNVWNLEIINDYVDVGISDSEIEKTSAPDIEDAVMNVVSDFKDETFSFVRSAKPIKRQKNSLKNT